MAASDSKRLDWIATFELWDRKKIGSLPLSDIVILIKCLGGNPSTKEVSKIFDEYKSSPVTLEQFLTIMTWIESEEQLRSDLVEAFRSLDVDENGFIHKDILKKHLTCKGKRPFSDEEFNLFIGDITVTTEGEIDLVLLSRTLMAKIVN